VNRASRKSLLIARERVLLHLLPLHRYVHDTDAPRSVTQEGIANSVDVGRNNVAKILQELENEGVVDVTTKHVKGMPSVRRVYFLSQRGFDEARRLKEEIETIKVQIIDLKGDEHEEDVGRLSLFIPTSYTFLELAMGVERGRFDCQSFHESKTKQERRFVDFSDKKPAVRNFFGREKEMRALHDLVTLDAPRAVVIFGIPGIGKTTLIAKFAQEVRDRTNVFWLKVHEWVNVRGLLRPLAEFLSQLGKKNLEWYLGQNEMPHTGEVLQILITDLQDISALLILDDVQKCERSVQELLSAMIGVLDEMPQVRIICATRDLPAFYSRSLVLKNIVMEVQLEGLDQESSVKMLQNRSVPVAQIEQLVKITKGHPLFLELIEDVGSAMGKNIRMFIEQEVVSKLEVAEKRIMNVAAVFRYPVIIDAFFITEEEIRKELQGLDSELDDLDYTVSYETVDSLLSKSILHESVGRMIGMHDLLREFTYTRLTPRQRTMYHRAASRFYLQDDSASSQVEGLHHCLMARDVAKSVEIAAGRGMDIIAKGYSNQFAPLLEKLLMDNEVKERNEILLLHGQIMELKGEYDLAMEEFEEVTRRIAPGTNIRVMADTLRRMGVIDIKRIRFDEAMVPLQRSLRLAEEMGDEVTLADIYYDLGGIAERRGHFPEAIALFEKAGICSKKVGDRSALGRSLYGIGRVRSSLGEYPEAIGLKKEAIAVLERVGDANAMAKVYVGLGSDLRAIDQNDEGVRCLEKSIELANSIGDVNTLGYAIANLTAEYLDRKELAKAEELMHQATRIFQKLDDQMMLATMHMYRGYLFHMRGDWDWAKEEFHSALSMLRALDAPSRMVFWLYEMALVYIEHGENEEARDVFQEAWEISVRIGNKHIMDLSRKELDKLEKLKGLD
jgi:tetratricopeptide (TPR) repeat protein